MADITKCANGNCKLKKECYRYTAIAGHEQGYLLRRDEVKNAADCEYFWDNEK
jgi:hypothetical protein